MKIKERQKYYYLYYPLKSTFTPNRVDSWHWWQHPDVPKGIHIRLEDIMVSKLEKP